MDSNHSVQFPAFSAPDGTQVHNFMRMPSLVFPGFQSLQEVKDSVALKLLFQVLSFVGCEGSGSRFMQLQRQNLQLFWSQQMLEIYRNSEYKQHHLPLARIKRVMKLDEDVKMISADAPILFSKACELFILELTLRSWMQAEENRRRTLQRSDIVNAINHGEVLDFLFDILPVEESKDEESGSDLGAAETHLTTGMHFPAAMDASQYHTFNGEYMIRQQEPSQQYFMIQPPMNSSERNNESPPK